MILLIGLWLAAVLRGFALESCLVPSHSMAGTLLAGDFVLVSKLHYGPRLPWPTNSLFGIKRLPGFQTPRRGDVVVFDRVGEDPRRRLIKRVIGTPGDVVHFKGSRIFVNGLPEEPRGAMQRAWILRMKPGTEPDRAALYRLGITEVEARQGEAGVFTIRYASARVAAEVADWPGVAEVLPCGDCAPYTGTVQLPGHGKWMPFTPDNAAPLARLINRYEGSGAEVRGREIWIDGAPAAGFLFTDDYYFVAGDNRDASLDSRTWGAVPGRNVIGKAVFVYFSWDPIDRTLWIEQLGGLRG